MTIGYISNSDCGRHDTGWGHPEHVGRLRAIPAALREEPELFQRIHHVESRHATEDELALAHGRAYIAQVRDLAARGGGRLDADTVASEGSWDAATAGAGAVLDAVDFAFGDAFPFDAGMDSLHGVAFEKGCYIGQEVVSRMRHRGTARRRVVAVHAKATLPEPGTEIVAGERPLGRLGSSAGEKGIGVVRLDRLRAALDEHLPVRAGPEEIAVALPVWATYGWPAASTAED